MTLRVLTSCLQSPGAVPKANDASTKLAPLQSAVDAVGQYPRSRTAFTVATTYVGGERATATLCRGWVVSHVQPMRSMCGRQRAKDGRSEDRDDGAKRRWAAHEACKSMHPSGFGWRERWRRQPRPVHVFCSGMMERPLRGSTRASGFGMVSRCLKRGGPTAGCSDVCLYTVRSFKGAC